MLRLLITAVALLLVTNAGAQKCTHPIKLIVIGSSTSAGTGPSKPDSTYVFKLRKFMIDSVNAGCTVENIAIGGATTYKMQPNWYTPPANRASFPVDTARNINKAISFAPDGIIINYPSNDAANNFTLQEQKDNFLRIKAKADSAGIPIWVTTTQPRNFTSATQKQLQTDMRDWINTTFGQKAIDFWTTIALPNGDIDPAYNSGDNVHLNDAGHALLFKRVVDEGIHIQLCDTPVAVQEHTTGINNVVVYPNPATNKLYVQVMVPYDNSAAYHITDMAGRTVMRGMIQQSSTTAAYIDISSLVTGSYFFELSAGDLKHRSLILKK